VIQKKQHYSGCIVSCLIHLLWEEVMSKSTESPSRLPTESPNPVIKQMYLEINNIAQGVNVGLLALVLTTEAFYSSFAARQFSIPLFALTSLITSIIFWSRYYFDTEILERSFTVVSAMWFFITLLTEGISIALITTPLAWLISTALVLFFGAGFYVLNLREIGRKLKGGLTQVTPEFVRWQRHRMRDLLILSLLAMIGAVIIWRDPRLALPIAVISFAASVWQLVITNAYRTQGFIGTGA
jgi:hypothetical protein